MEGVEKFKYLEIMISADEDMGKVVTHRKYGNVGEDMVGEHAISRNRNCVVRKGGNIYSTLWF